jgi:hypothetical protein
MLTAKPRLHIENPKETNGRAIIVGDRAALKVLGEALIKASKNVLGLEQVELYASDGQKYEILITCDISEDEWRGTAPPYNPAQDLSKLQVVVMIDEIKNTLVSEK